VQKDIQDVVGKDIKTVKGRFEKERKVVEKKVEKVVVKRMKQAAKFLESRKGELDQLQKKIEAMIPADKKKTIKKKAK
jgi:hypothetical protein